MGQPNQPSPVKLIVGQLTRDPALFDLAAARMTTLFGPIDLTSETIPFTDTDYYSKAMGQNLLRQFVSFTDLIDPGRLAQIKHASNQFETDLAETAPGRALNVQRPINLDPGYLDPSKLVLATTKNYSHRIYIGSCMYAEATLHYHHGSWHAWPYTYPDYASPAYHDFLTSARQKLMETLSSQKQST